MRATTTATAAPDEERGSTVNEYYPHIFEPLSVGGVTFKNRVFTAPTMARAALHRVP